MPFLLASSPGIYSAHGRIGVPLGKAEGHILTGWSGKLCRARLDLSLQGKGILAHGRDSPGVQLGSWPSPTAMAQSYSPKPGDSC